MNPRPLKVFGWMSARRYPDADGHSRQLELIVAASSQAEALRLGKEFGARRDYMGGPTGNPYQIAAACAAPSVILAARRNHRHQDGYVRFDPAIGLGEPIAAVDAAIAAVEPPSWMRGL